MRVNVLDRRCSLHDLCNTTGAIWLEFWRLQALSGSLRGHGSSLGGAENKLGGEASQSPISRSRLTEPRPTPPATNPSPGPDQASAKPPQWWDQIYLQLFGMFLILFSAYVH